MVECIEMHENSPLLANLSIVLVRPKIPENIGAAARIAYNMGIQRLVVVRSDLPQREAMAKMATHKAAHLIDNIELFSELPEALSNFSFLVGTTARRGRQRGVEQNPREIVKLLAPQLTTNKVGILFGAEDTGLTNEELKHCHLISAIPTADFSSINLAQAVAIHCYEIHHEIIQSSKDMTPVPKLASSFELESMYGFLEKSLSRIQFLDETNHSHWMGNIRRFLSRTKLSSKETNIIRGICKKFIEFTGDTTSKEDEEKKC